MKTEEPGDCQIQRELSVFRARHEAFYSQADEDEARLMDALYCLHAATELGVNTPRDRLSYTDREGFEEALDDCERLYMSACDAVTASRAYRALATPDQETLAEDCMTVKFEGGN